MRGWRGASPAEAVEHAEVREFRRTRAKRESPRALFWVGVAIAILTALNAAVGLLNAHTIALHLSISVIVWIAAFVISRPGFAPRLVPGLVGVCTVLVTAEFQYEVWVEPTPLGYGYVLMIMLAGAPMLLSPSVLLWVGTASIAGSVAIATVDPWVMAPGNRADWVIAAVTAEVIGAILLLLRLRSIDDLGKVMRAAEAIATHDALTGLLNRRGMEQVLPGIVAHASRRGEQMYACFVDIDWLKTANDTYGHDFGDEVIRAVASSVAACVAPGAAIARWGGDEFLVVNVGANVGDDELAAALRRSLETHGIDLAKWPGAVSIGSATAKATETSIASLIAAADAHMYERRRTKRRA